MKKIKLSGRLNALVDMIAPGASVADIGTDHGFLPVYLAQTALAKNIIASDISAASLDSARRSAAEYNVTTAIRFVAAPGLSGISPNEADTIVIAGMGGETILKILKETPWIKRRKIKLILQPQSKLDLLARFLYDNGYIIQKTQTVRDKGKRYTIMLCETK